MQPNREVQQKVFSSCPQIIRKETVSFIMKLSRSLIIIFLFLAFFLHPLQQTATVKLCSLFISIDLSFPSLSLSLR